MKILVAYYSKSGGTEKVAMRLAQFFEARKNTVQIFRVTPVHELKASEYKKGEKDLPLKNPLVDLRNFDLVLVGTPVWGFSPTPIIISYLRNLTAVKGKRFVLFATCMAFPGTTIKKMSGIVSTKGGIVADSITVKSIFELDGKKLQEVEKFAEKILGSA